MNRPRTSVAAFPSDWHRIRPIAVVMDAAKCTGGGLAAQRCLPAIGSHRLCADRRCSKQGDAPQLRPEMDESRCEADAKGGQRIFDLRRDLAVVVAKDDPVGDQLLQLLGKNLVTDLPDRASQRAVAQCAPRQMEDDQRLPFAAHDLERRIQSAGERGGHLFVRSFFSGYLPSGAYWKTGRQPARFPEPLKNEESHG